jgi:phage terminase small subunit
VSAKNEHGLTPQQELFAQEVAKGRSLAQAYRAAYPRSEKWKADSVHQAASKLMADSKVSPRVDALRAAAADRAELDAAEIIREVRRLATSDIAGIMHPDGRVKLPHELDPATRAAVASFKIDEYGRIEYKFWDKGPALDKAMKHLGLYEVDNAQKTAPLVGEIRLVGLAPKDTE